MSGGLAQVSKSGILGPLVLTSKEDIRAPPIYAHRAWSLCIGERSMRLGSQRSLADSCPK